MAISVFISLALSFPIPCLTFEILAGLAISFVGTRKSMYLSFSGIRLGVTISRTQDGTIDSV
jgi:hypothetical protein